MGEENCVGTFYGKWRDERCSNVLLFICYRTLMLVKEKKAWEEALQYCRMYYNDLYSPVTNSQLYLSEVEDIQPETLSVWTGLRVLNGEWFLLNTWPLKHMSSLPSCPAQQQRCGAQNTETSVWENRDCNEKLSFLCYRR